ncbi:NAD(P)H-dependent oxidoreductase [Stappia sp. F7233]|uniref:FMN dependent NADH:quinone oxidoreductase n=1 Tax=Stappia albiluteola TaxID=2758565 RepID=A0A839ABQ2_9HYPH|nr:NAD(P)H-dependent oxidoreductase [Stappia albiluteola]MBA5776468.1 NAD(P)H-dependent oxidoreductase [Stappia albiluteola]
MKLLHVDSSPKGEHSNSRALSRYFVDRLGERVPDLEIDYLDVAAEPLSPPSGLFTRAIYTPPPERTDEMNVELAASDRLCERALDANALVMAMPMHNFSMPAAFKAFVDNLVRVGVTYTFNEDGRPVGRFGRHRVLFITSRGADLRAGGPMAHMDALTPALRAAFGFIGVSAPEFVDAQPLQFADRAAHEAALARAKAELDGVAREWGGGLPAQGSEKQKA